jgi:probable F420-dependent oxidoreductase
MGTNVRLGFGAWGETVAEMVEAARRAEAGGFESVWTTELHRSPFVPAAAISTATESVTVGTAIALAFVRSELSTALSALDLDDLSNGRFVLGLGSGVQRLVTDWHNATFGKPVQHLRETVALVRLFVASAHLGEPIDSSGDYHDVHVRNYERPFAPRREAIPIYVAAMGPAMTRLAGEVGDGWLAHELGSPSYLRERVLPQLEAGMTRAGRKPGDVTRVVSACCVPHSDSAQAKRWAAGLVAFYASVRTYLDFFAFHGFERETLAIQAAFRDGDFDAMVDACPDEMVDAFTFAGTPDEILEGVRRYEGVADVIKLSPPTHFVPPEVTRLAQDATLELFGT